MTETKLLTRSCIDHVLKEYDLLSVAACHNFVMDHLPANVMDTYTIYTLTPFQLTVIIPELCGYDD